MFGVGPGALPSDAFMMGIDPLKQRDMMTESLRALVPLLRGETVSMKTDWFELAEARLQLVPYTQPHVEIAVASQVSPAGARAAGEFGLGLLSIGATSTGGFNALASNWNICEERAKEFGQTVDRGAWRLVGPVHIAETREQARKDVEFGLDLWLKYFREIAALPLAPEGGTQDAVDALNASGLAVIGTVDDMIEQLERLEQQSGGYGCFMNMAHEWADHSATLHSYELMARYVMPEFQDLTTWIKRSNEWSLANKDALMGGTIQAIAKAIQEQGGGVSPPTPPGH